MDHGKTITAGYVAVDLDARELSNPVWGGAQTAHITHYWSGADAPVAVHAEVRLLWSDESLHVRFVCNQHQPLLVSANPQLERKTIGLWDRDVCEIFIAPVPSHLDRYFEFEAAPTGEWVDLEVCFKDGKLLKDFDYISGMTVTSRVSGRRLEIAMHIPWSITMPKPESGDEWRVNLFRCVGLGNERYLAWQPTFAPEPNFHVPAAFGKLRFI